MPTKRTFTFIAEKARIIQSAIAEAVFVSAFVRSIWQEWLLGRARDRGESIAAGVDVRPRYWFNAAAVSRHYLIPGSITIIMTVMP